MTTEEMKAPLFRSKMTAAEIKEVDIESGVVTAIVSDESPDRDNDIIRVSGWEFAAFRDLPIMLADHDYSIDSAIGRWRDVRIEGTSVIGEAEYFLNQGNDLADKAFALAQNGLAAFSVGFRTYPEHTKRLESGGYEYTKQELLEISQVAIPANRNALAIAKQIAAEWKTETPEIETAQDLDEIVSRATKQVKDLAAETERLQGIITQLIEVANSVNEHMMYMIDTADTATATDDEQKPKPNKPKPDDYYRAIQHIVGAYKKE
jgi:hypothetical protein